MCIILYLSKYLLWFTCAFINPVFPVWAAGGLWAWERAVRHVVPEPTVPGPTLPPVFDPRVSNNVTVTATKTARLSCVVHNLGNNSVTIYASFSVTGMHGWYFSLFCWWFVAVFIFMCVFVFTTFLLSPSLSVRGSPAVPVYFIVFCNPLVLRLFHKSIPPSNSASSSDYVFQIKLYLGHSNRFIIFLFLYSLLVLYSKELHASFCN